MKDPKVGWLVRLWRWLKSKKKGASSAKYLILLISLSSLTWSAELLAAKMLSWSE